MHSDDQDDVKQFGPPLDYSFKELRKMSGENFSVLIGKMRSLAAFD